MIALAMAVQAVLPDAAPTRSDAAAPTAPATQESPPPAAIGPSPQAPAASPSPGAGVSSYPAAFFAAAQPTTAYDMVARLPGFTLDDGSGVRGYGGAAGNVIVDGQRPASKNDDLVSVLRRIPAAQIDRIDVIRGGGGGIDMQGKAVIANVVRRAGTGTSLAATLTQQGLTSDGRAFTTARIEATHEGVDGRSWGASLNAGRTFDDGAGSGGRVTRDGTGQVVGRARDDTRSDGPDVTATASYGRPLWGGQLRVNASGEGSATVSTERVSPVGLGADPADASDERDVQRGATGEVGIDYTRALGKRLTSETVLLQQLTGETYLSRIRLGPATGGDLQLFRERHVQSESIARETLTWTASSRLTVEGGAEGDYNLLTSHTRFDDDGAAQVVPAANVRVDEARGEAFAKGTWQATRKLGLELGLRLEASRIGSSGDVALGKTLVYPKPRLLATWSPTAPDQFRLRLEREVGQLNFSDFVATSSFSTGQIRAGNPNLVPQDAAVAEATWERHFLKDGATVLTVRHSALSDVVDRAPVFSSTGSFDTPANIGNGRKDELLLTATVPLRALGLAGATVKANATWRRSSVTDPTTGGVRPISGVRPFEGGLTLDEDLPRRHLTLSASFNPGWTQRFFYYNQIERDRLRPFGSIELDYKPRRHLTLAFEIYEIGTEIDRRITSWTATRASGPFDAVQDRGLGLGPALLFRIRRDV